MIVENVDCIEHGHVLIYAPNEDGVVLRHHVGMLSGNLRDDGAAMLLLASPIITSEVVNGFEDLRYDPSTPEAIAVLRRLFNLVGLWAGVVGGTTPAPAAGDLMRDILRSFGGIEARCEHPQCRARVWWLVHVRTARRWPYDETGAAHIETCPGAVIFHGIPGVTDKDQQPA